LQTSTHRSCPMRMNGIMIDCSRLMERHEYYYRLVDFMAEWGMNTLLWHFTDDHGCGIALPGFEKFAMPRAFAAREARELVRYAGRKGIEVIPEIETFGHTRYLTDFPEFERLYAGPRFGGRKPKHLWWNALDPLEPESWDLARRLMAAAGKVFTSRRLHIGCDEVNLKQYVARRPGLDGAQVWTDYVNRMIGLAHAAGRTPMMWADHPAKDENIAKALRKDVTLVYWNYWHSVDDAPIKMLRKVGFREIVISPSIAWWGVRFFPTGAVFENLRRMTRIAAKHKAAGVIDTVWCPWRYVQDSLWYAMAYGARLARGGGRLRAFRGEFARRVFGTALTRPLAGFLDESEEVRVTWSQTRQIWKRTMKFSREDIARFGRTRRAGAKALAMAAKYAPAKNARIWDAMVLAVRAAWLVSEWRMLSTARRAERARVSAYNGLLRLTRRELAETWDAGRYADDPRKNKARFPGEDDQYALLLMRRLPILKQRRGPLQMPLP
jgi:hypothetical protein